MDHEDTEKGKALPSDGESVQGPQTPSDKSVADALIPQNSRAMICSSTIIWKEISTVSFWEPSCPPIVSREEWGARLPKKRQDLTTPVPLVIIHHTYSPPACHSLEDCKKALVEIQNFHMNDRGWDDIAYNFLVGDEYLFMGRGWQTVGAHAKGFNNNSIGICFIGDYREEIPSPRMLILGSALIKFGIDNHFISANYKLIGHRQVRNTECPGEAFYNVIKTASSWGPMDNSPPPSNVTGNQGGS
uniref:Peptidoglycan-recognition protein n=1 Tax=Homalodisca liturata TaxID=320908 RepID=A0A1B6IUS5_9HEMI